MACLEEVQIACCPRRGDEKARVEETVGRTIPRARHGGGLLLQGKAVGMPLPILDVKQQGGSASQEPESGGWGFNRRRAAWKYHNHAFW